MFELEHNLDGEHGVGLVAYMYGELDPASRTAFETHLATCEECALELGSFADARLGVIEWRREDFDPLATPVILVPESEPIAAFADRPAVAGSFKAFWDAVLSSPLAVRMGAGLTAVSLVAAVVYFTAFSGQRSVEVANQKPAQAVVDNIPTPRSEEPIPEAAKYKPTEEPKRPKSEKVVDSHMGPRTQLASSQVTVKPVMTRNVRPRSETAISKAPRLNNVEEEEDKSLRLSDLFAEIGSSEE